MKSIDEWTDSLRESADVCPDYHLYQCTFHGGIKYVSEDELRRRFPEDMMPAVLAQQERLKKRHTECTNALMVGTAIHQAIEDLFHDEVILGQSSYLVTLNDAEDEPIRIEYLDPERMFKS